MSAGNGNGARPTPSGLPPLRTYVIVNMDSAKAALIATRSLGAAAEVARAHPLTTCARVVVAELVTETLS